MEQQQVKEGEPPSSSVPGEEPAAPHGDRIEGRHSPVQLARPLWAQQLKGRGKHGAPPPHAETPRSLGRLGSSILRSIFLLHRDIAPRFADGEKKQGGDSGEMKARLRVHTATKAFIGQRG